MMPILLDIPAYRGAYRMDADADQEEMVEIRDLIMEAVMSEDERREAMRSYYEAERWTSAELQEAVLIRLQELLPERLDRRDRHGWTVRELLAEFERLAQKVRSY